MTFTPHLLPTRRGILATVYGRLRPGKTGADAAAAIERFVADRPFLRAAKPDAVRLHPVVGTNRVLLGADADPERGVAVAFAALDNLVKGAAGQAVQNANLMLGLDETTGLLGLAGSAPRRPTPLRPREELRPSAGFRFGACGAGSSRRARRGAIGAHRSEAPCAAAGVFTVNRMRAAPSTTAPGRLPASGIRAIVANSGNANAITARRRRRRARRGDGGREGLGVEADTVLTASTGAIGIPLPVERIAAAVPALVAALGDDAIPAAEAIRTTDLRTKVAFREIDIGGQARCSSRRSPRARG